MCVYVHKLFVDMVLHVILISEYTVQIYIYMFIEYKIRKDASTYNVK